MLLQLTFDIVKLFFDLKMKLEYVNQIQSFIRCGMCDAALLLKEKDEIESAQYRPAQPGFPRRFGAETAPGLIFMTAYH